MNTNKFSIYYHSGGGDTIRIVDKYWQLITFILNKMSEIEYSSEIDQFHIALRVDGEYLKFGDPVGCNSLKFFKKKGLIANSISFDEKIYRDENLLSDFLKKNLLFAFEQMITRLEKVKIKIDKHRLLLDLRNLIDENWVHNE